MGEALAGRRRWIWLSAAVVVLALIVFGVVRATGAGAEAKPAAAATVAVDRGDVTTEVATTGTVQPSQTRSLSFAVAGTVESVPVRAGTTVTEGQVLAKVDDTDAAEAVDNAQSALDDAQTALDKATTDATEQSTTPSTCGRVVAYGSDMNGSKAGADRVSGVGADASQGNAGRIDVDTAYVSEVVVAETAVSGSPSGSPSPSASARPSGSPTPTATGPATGTKSPSSPQSPNGTKAPARTPARNGTSAPGCTGSQTQSRGGQGAQNGGTGQDPILSAQQRVTQATTTLQNAEQALDGATITAPIAGKILSVSGTVGNQVSAGSTFLTLADTYDMQISAQFPEADADHLAVRQKAVVTLADQPGTQFKATVVQVDPTGTSDGTMVRYGVLLGFDDAPKDLLVGQSAAVKVTTGDKTGVLRVPSTAVHDVAGATGTVLKGGTPTTVGIGLRGDQYTEITNGLSKGDAVTQSW